MPRILYLMFTIEKLQTEGNAETKLNKETMQ